MEGMTEFRGIVVPILTPMHADERIDEAALGVHIERMIDGGAHGIFCLGTNGEAYALGPADKQRIIMATVQHVNGRVPVYAGTGCVSTRETIGLSRFAKDAGVQALSVITPYFAALSQDQLFDHYRALSEAVDCPLIAYNMPARTGVSIAPETWQRMLALPTMAGIKDSSGSLDNMLAYLEIAKGSGKAVFAGNDSLILPNLLAGGNGGIAGCANVYPRTLTGIYEDFTAGRIEAAEAKQESLRTLRDCFRYGNPNTMIKLAANLRGFAVGPCRRPFDGTTPEGMRALEQVLRENAQKGMS